MSKRFLALLFALAAPLAPAIAEQSTAATSASPLDMRIGQLVSVLKGELAPDAYFTDAFLAAVPPVQFKALSDSLIAQFGQPLRIIEIKKTGAATATVTVAYEKANGTIELRVNDTPDAKVNTLYTKGFAPNDDSMAKIDGDFAALPGRSGYVVQELGSEGSVKTIAARKSNEQFAIGSTFKLYILAELVSEIDAGERNWTDVEPLHYRSLSSTATNNWPIDSPATLHSLATWMISVSDNSATDTLLHLLGREKVEQKLALIGHSNPDKALPLLSTVEAFALKTDANADLRKQYLSADEAGQRAVLDKNPLNYNGDNSNPFADGPAYIDSIEWFGSPEDMGNVMNAIRRTGNQAALDILTVNKGVRTSSSAKWKYLGYKGGSEPGVISLTFLGQKNSGQWVVVSGIWNDTAKPVEDAEFVDLMERLLDQASQ